MTNRSKGLTEAASTLTRTSPSDGSGSGTSWIEPASPNWSRANARMGPTTIHARVVFRSPPRRAARTLTRVRKVEEGWFEREGVDLHYLEWKPEDEAEPGTPILLLHGLSSNARYWERV